MRAARSGCALGRWILGAVFTLAVAGAPARSEEQEQRVQRSRSIAIFVLTTAAVESPLSELYAAARDRIEEETTLDVQPFEVFSLALRESVIRQCAGDSECFAGQVRAAGIEADFLLLVSVTRLGTDLSLGLRHVALSADAEKEGPSRASGESLPHGTSLVRAIRDGLSAVFPESIWGQVASLEITSQASNTEVLVAGRRCVTPCVLTRLAPGPHAIVAHASGFERWEGSVTLSAHALGSIQIAPTKVASSWTASPWFWGVLVAAAAGVAAGTALAVRPSSEPLVVCIGNDARACGP